MSGKNEQGSMDVTQKNVFNAPLHKHSTSKNAPSNLPSTIHAGMCNSSNPLALTLTNGFLDFSASTGTDLRASGLGPGQRFCMEASQWKKALDKGIDDLPRVKLESSHVEALKSVDLATLKKYAAEADVNNEVVRPEDNKEGWARESDQIGGKEPRA